MPSKQPQYRNARSHRDFVTNIKVSRADIKAALQEAWGASRVLEEFPRGRIHELVRQKYAQDAWNFKF
jgi:lipoate-protein ligase A